METATGIWSVTVDDGFGVILSTDEDVVIVDGPFTMTFGQDPILTYEGVEYRCDFQGSASRAAIEAAAALR